MGPGSPVRGKISLCSPWFYTPCEDGENHISHKENKWQISPRIESANSRMLAFQPHQPQAQSRMTPMLTLHSSLVATAQTAGPGGRAAGQGSGRSWFHVWMSYLWWGKGNTFQGSVGQSWELHHTPGCIQSVIEAISLPEPITASVPAVATQLL